MDSPHALLSLLIFTLLPIQGASLLTTSDFESGTDGWTHPVNTPNQTTTQLTSPFNQVLSVTASGTGGPGSRLVVPNTSAAWTGDYAAAGITSVSLDLSNNSLLTLQLRIGISGPSGNRWVTDPITLNPSDSGNYTFSLTPSSLLAAGGSNVNSALSNVEEIRILHNSSLDWRGALVAGSFQTDNITLIPEPSISLLLSASSSLFLIRRKTRR